MLSFEKFIQKIAKEAGGAVLKRFGKDQVHYQKSAHRIDAVTKADLLSDKILVSAIKKAYPEHGIISEESGKVNEAAEYVWILDPIDGTFNFAFGVPLFGVMIALAHKGKVILAAVNMPATNEFFYAREGRGAFLNGRRIHCSNTRTIVHSAGYGGSTLRDRAKTFVEKIIHSEKAEYMILGSFNCCANHCYVAAGRRDWIVSVSGKIWDFAPAYLLLKESGCKVTDVNGKPWKLGMLEMVAANPRLHKQLLKLTKGI